MTMEESPDYWITYLEDRQPLYHLLMYVALERSEDVKAFLDIYMPSTLRTLTDYSNCKINWMGGETQYRVLSDYVPGFTVPKADNSGYYDYLCEHIAYFYTYLHIKTATATREIYKLIPLEEVLKCHNRATWYGTEAEAERIAGEVGLKILIDEETQLNILSMSRFTNPTYGVPGDEEEVM